MTPAPITRSIARFALMLLPKSSALAINCLFPIFSCLLLSIMTSLFVPPFSSTTDTEVLISKLGLRPCQSQRTAPRSIQASPKSRFHQAAFGQKTSKSSAHSSPPKIPARPRHAACPLKHPVPNPLPRNARWPSVSHEILSTVARGRPDPCPRAANKMPGDAAGFLCPRLPSLPVAGSFSGSRPDTRPEPFS